MEKKTGAFGPIINTILKVYAVADNIISPLGLDTSQNYNALIKGQSGIRSLSQKALYPEPFYSALLDRDVIDQQFDARGKDQYTFLEKMFILSIKDILTSVKGIDKKKLLVIVSSTKGNIDLLEAQGMEASKNQERLQLTGLAKQITQFFDISTPPVVISNACISGISALLTAKKLISMNLYDHVLVTGGDILSGFTISGFQCLKAISDGPCRPYDSERTGVSLGEGVGSVLLSNDPGLNVDRESLAVIRGGGQSNDANHISGPSRTGKGLKIAIEKALSSSQVDRNEIDYINAHGTATVFNDEMEAIAFSDLEMGDIPLNSLKGYFGHTLGAAGIIETIISIRQLNRGLLLKTQGYEHPGVSKEINVLKDHVKNEQLQYVLKTASGFGGCNAALVLEKDGFSHISI